MTPPAIGQVSYLAQTKTTQNVNNKPNAKNSISVPCSYFKDFEREHPIQARNIRAHADHAEVVPTKENVEIRQNKAETEFVYPDSEDPDYILAVQFAKRHLSYIQSDLSIGEPLEFKGSSASGIIGKNTGTPKTEDHLQSKLFDQYKWDINHIPIQVVQTKDEFLSPEDLERKKIRFVDCVPKEFLFKQKILFDKQNKKLIKHCNEKWIKYGFVKQFGGFDTLCTEYEKCSVISFSDVSGYDIASVLLAVYMIRLFYLDISQFAKTPEEQQFIDSLIEYVVYYTLNPVRLQPNGQILQFDKSNSSGQNNTAPDNSILHVIITFFIFIVVWRDLFFKNPTYEEIVDHTVVSLYSDDKAVGYVYPFVPDPIRLKELENQVYKKFGMTIKESASKIITHTPGELFKDNEFEFLGSYNKWIEEEDCYFMIPRERKLATSATKVLTCTKQQLTPVDHYLKLVQLEIQLNNTNLKDDISFYRKWFQNRYNNLHLINEIDQIDYLKNIHDISPEVILYLTTGRESSLDSSRKNFNFFFLRGGRRLDLNYIMSARATKAELRISKAALAAGCTPDGVVWMKNAIDPFPDVKRRIVGYPDTIKTPSVTQYFREEKVVNVPAGVTSNWDCNILHPGYMGTQTMCATAQENGVNFSLAAQGTAYTTSMIDIRSAVSGTALGVTTTTDYIPPAVSLTTMPWRTVALGFEVFNTTAPLYKQGSLVTWRQPATQGEPQNVQIGATLTTKLTPSSMQMYAEPPETSANALLLDGSLEWEAEKGAYLVGLNSKAINRQKMGWNTRKFAAYAKASTGTWYIPTIVNSTNTAYVTATDSESSFDQFGVYLTGLSKETNLKVVVHYLMERFPDYNDPDLISIATPSIPYDPQALELYSKIASQIPTGTEVDNNMWGAFLSGLARVATVVGPPMIGALDSYLNPKEQVAQQDQSAAIAQMQEIARLKADMSAQQNTINSIQQSKKLPKTPVEKAKKKEKKKAKKAVPVQRLIPVRRIEPQREIRRESVRPRGPPVRRYRNDILPPIPSYVPTIKPNRPKDSPQDRQLREYQDYLKWQGRMRPR